jgi:hypothetical protein
MASPTLAAFTAQITENGTNTAASLVLTGTPAGSTACSSTNGADTPFTSDAATCAANPFLPGTELSNSSSTAEVSTFATVGTVAPTSATLASTAVGTEIAPDMAQEGSSDVVTGDDAFPFAGATFGSGGPLSANKVTLDGSTGLLETEQLVNDPSANLTLSAWFKVASSYASGGGIISFQNTQGNATPADTDRKVWMDDSGHICAGEYNGSAEEIACSTTTFNNAAWHYVAASFSSSSGLTVYVDGTSVATNASATTGQNYAGYWDIGYTYYTGSNWAPEPASKYLAGSLAEVAVFPSALSSSAVGTLYGSGSGTEAAFETRVLADSPSQFWPLQSASSTTNLPTIAKLQDVSGNNNLATPEGGLSQTDIGPLSDNGSMYFDGTSNAYAETTTDNAALPSAFTMAVWFRAPSGLSTGGGILDLNTTQGGGGSGDDPAIWMDNSGKIVAYSYISGQHYATSSAAYNDGNWHFLVATVSSGGLKLYIDGSLITTTSAATGGGTLGGYWVLGYTGSGLTDSPSDAYWTGNLAHVAYFASALTGTQISTLYAQSTPTAFESQLLADSPTAYWPLVDSGTTESENYPFFQVVPDYSGGDDPATVVGSSVSLGAAGPYSSSFSGAFTGGSGWLESARSMTGPDTFTLAAWFKAPSHATGGVIFDFDSAQNSTGLSHDRSIWMDNSGKIVAGISGGSGVEVTSPSTYDNNAWHLVVAVFTSSSLTLYIDSSTAVASTSSGISDVNYTGWWDIGYGYTNSWSDIPSDEYWDGEIADAAVIPSALSSGTVGTLVGEGSQSALNTELLSLSPSEYWTIGDSASNATDAGAVELSLQAANNGTTTCLFPAGSGSCPSLGESNFVPLASTWAPATPTSSHSTTLTASAEESSSAPAGFAGLHFVVPLTFAGAASSWSASLDFADANVWL